MGFLCTVIISLYCFHTVGGFGALYLVMLHRALLVPSLNRGWITATLCSITACQTLIFKGAECCCTNCLPSTTTPTLLSRPSYKDLHWLSVRGRIDYKIAFLCYKAVKLRQPSYLLLVYSRHIRQSRVSRSSTSDWLSTQSSSTNMAARRFSCCAPTIWNSLPSFVLTADSFTNFRSQLKTRDFARHV